MDGRGQWNQAAYESSVTSRSWTYSDYDGGWASCRDSTEIRAIFEEELALGGVPTWAEEIAARMLASPLPPCGHYTSPRPILQACRAIGNERCPEFVVGCYTAEPGRKELLAHYVFCLDAWLGQAPLDIAQAELALRPTPGKDWGRIAEAVYATLGERTEPRALLVERLIHRLRWWLKTLIWEDDRRDSFQLDAYLGDVRGSGKWGEYGNPGFADPYFAELRTPAMQELAGRIQDRVPDAREFLANIEQTWLCAPKAFRYIERIVLAIGSVGTEAEPDYDATPLDCEDTYPDFDSQASWFRSFTSRLDRWLDGDEGAVPELGRAGPAKHWLARMLRLRLHSGERMRNLVGLTAHGKSGTGAASAGEGSPEI